MTDAEFRAYARQGGKQRALDGAIAARLAEGWTEVTDDPEFAPRVEGVRLFVRPERDDGERDYPPDTGKLCCCDTGQDCPACMTGRCNECLDNPERERDDDEEDGWWAEDD